MQCTNNKILCISILNCLLKQPINMSQLNTSKEIELQNLLADERERCSQFKQLYQTIKEEHSK